MPRFGAAKAMQAVDYVRGWAAAGLAYAISDVGTTLVHRWVAGQTVNPFGQSVAPWVIPAVLSVIAAVVAVRKKVTASWWKWLILTITVPTVVGTILATRVLGQAVNPATVTYAVITHVVLAGVLGVSLGTVLNATRRAATRLR